ncbi:MAG TPA: UDP-glucose/GDP-mannose dehydrogenase family protein [Candidatus Saccharibacteria bacterium]|nr:UDP-glucose/GDP-mannose dehydrogenase family protein [Candidatus Saccharibacteria bacterium]
MSSSENKNTITVLGAGYVGLTSAALFAHCGYKVYLIEPNKERLDVIKQGKSFFYEEGLDPVIKLAIDSGDLIPTNSYVDSVPHSSIVFSCVGTPDNPDGSSNLTYVYSAAEETAKHAKKGTVYVQKSTVPVGTGAKIVDLFKGKKVDMQYVSNPEFLREGTAVYDTLYFDRVVVGGDNKVAVDAVMDIYFALERFRDHIAHIARVPTGARGDKYIATGLNSAELIKVSSNAFLALKISFANSIAILADKAGADVVEVMDAVGADNRIGRAFLNAGRGYGGGCFPKDVSGLISSGLEYGVDLEIMQAAQAQNQLMPGYVVDKLQDAVGQLTGKRIAVLGLAFKAGTSDVRKSPGVAIANKLKEAGADVISYDPQANEEAASDLHDDVKQVETIDEAIKGADAAVIATEWSEILKYPAESFAQHLKTKVLLDAVNQYNAIDATTAGLTYLGVGHSV